MNNNVQHISSYAYLNAMGLYKLFIKMTINKIAILCLVTAIDNV